MGATQFKELLNVCIVRFHLSSPLTVITTQQLILLIGNYMNGTGIKGGAFGFRVSSINKVKSLAVSTRHPQYLTIRFSSSLIPSR
jgi:hypothetical protein